MCGSSRGRAASPLAVLLVAACASNTAPPGFLPTPQESQATAYGGWIEVEWGRGDPKHTWLSEGELLAIQHDSVYILTGRGPEVVATAEVRRAQLTGYDSQLGKLASWTLIGTLSTASHGIWLVVSAPLWVVTGSINGAKQSRAPERVYPRARWEDLRSYARFPQGLPPGIDLAKLRGKPLR